METLKFAFYIAGTLFFVGMIIFFIAMAFFGNNEEPIRCDLGEKPNFYFEAIRELQEKNKKNEAEIDYYKNKYEELAKKTSVKEFKVKKYTKSEVLEYINRIHSAFREVSVGAKPNRYLHEIIETINFNINNK